MDWSEAERRAAGRPGDQAESEGKRPSDQTLAERDMAVYKNEPPFRKVVTI